MLNSGEARNVKFQITSRRKTEVKENKKVQRKSKIVPFLLVCVSILVITQIVV